jgi:hypothetical protein
MLAEATSQLTSEFSLQTFEASRMKPVAQVSQVLAVVVVTTQLVSVFAAHAPLAVGTWPETQVLQEVAVVPLITTQSGIVVWQLPFSSNEKPEAQAEHPESSFKFAVAQLAIEHSTQTPRAFGR